MGFSTPSYDLNDLFRRVDHGDLQLPDFQREYRWDIDRIRALLVTVLRGYPMGSFMALDTRNTKLRFRPRPLEGAPHTDRDPGMLLLDGQQRLTTLYHCLRGDGIVDSVDFRNKRIRRKFYIDINRAVQYDVLPEEAVFSVDEAGQVMSHFAGHLPQPINSRESELAAGVIPVCSLLTDVGTDMLFELAASSQQVATVKHFNNQVIKPLVRYNVPMIRLDRETAQAGIGSIFAQANSAGLQMDVFELLTAVFATEDPDFSLQEDWARTEAVLASHAALAGITRTDFLSAVALYVSGSGYRESVVKLSLQEYVPAADRMREAFDKAAQFLEARCIITIDHVPYTEQLLPLAVIIAKLDDAVLAQQHAQDRLNQWFWCGVFGEIYGSAAVMVRAGNDVAEVTHWILQGGEVPQTVRTARFVESRLLSASSDSGLSKGIDALIMGRGARDWRTGEPFNKDTYMELGTHFRRIFPKEWCQSHGINEVLSQSVLNRTSMSRRTWVMVADSSPARYLYRLQSKSLMDDAEFDQVLESHLLNPALLWLADAEKFFRDRRGRILRMIEEAMGVNAMKDVDESDLSAGLEGPDAFES